MTRSPEVISTVERRRRWTAEEKVAILDAAFRPGGSVASAAERNDVSRALIYLWRKQARAGEIPGVSISARAVTRFAPVRVVERAEDLPEQKPAVGRSRERRPPAVIEITLANGRVVKWHSVKTRTKRVSEVERTFSPRDHHTALVAAHCVLSLPLALSATRLLRTSRMSESGHERRPVLT